MKLGSIISTSPLQFSELQTLIFVVACIVQPNVLNAKIVKHVFVVNYMTGSPDGVYKEKIFAINGQFPGPIIKANLGDTLEIDLVNVIQDGQNVSLHWHGIHQKGTPFEDGASQITQCPLKNGFIQKYQFKLRQSGTYWYHSHVQSQYTEGLFGALIVYNKPREAYAYDGEIIITLNEWYHRTARENEEWHLSPRSRGVPPYPDSGLMNGVGRYPCNFAKLQDRICNTTFQRRPVFHVQRNQTYRVRVINTGGYAAFNFSIDGHILETIEVDGVDTARPVLVNYAVIGAAQRYSFLIHTTNNNNNNNSSSTSDNKDRYLIRAQLRNESLLLLQNININEYPWALMPDLTGVLQYMITNDSKSEVQTTLFEPHSYLEKVPQKELFNTSVRLDEMKLSPLDGIPAPPYFNKEFILEAGFYEDEQDIRRGSFNKRPFKLPDHAPILFQLLDYDEREGRRRQQLSPSVFPLEVDYMDYVQVIINNPFYGPHPFHMHGSHFYVLGTGNWGDGNFDAEKHGKKLTLDGVRRDTVLVQEKSWGVIRFRADNVGIWTLHCHIDWHNLSGMAMTFVVGKDELRRTINITDEARRVCSYHQFGNDGRVSSGGGGATISNNVCILCVASVLCVMLFTITN